MAWVPKRFHVQDDPHKALKDKGIIDSRCSRHMTRNKAHLADYQEFKGGTVAFRGTNGRITGKGKIKAERLDFEDVYYVEELKHYNLFSKSQMCDKKNKVLFIDTDYLVMSPDFKLHNENQVLLKIHRQHNMYSFNLKNVDPFVDLACLFVKASIDESNKWHRRLGHVNFKNLNKLVKGNLVRGIKREYSNARSSQQNGVAEIKNGTFIEAARTMVLVTKPQNKTPYELLTVENQVNKSTGPKKANNSAGTQDNDDQVESLRKEATHDIQNASNSSTNLINTASTPLCTAGPLRAFNDGELSYPDHSKYALPYDHLMPHLKDIYASPSEGIFTDSSYDHKGVFQIQKVWILVDLPFRKKAIRTKWVYRNKKDEKGVVVRNKARLVTQGHRQEEGIDYDEFFAPVARIEAMRIFLAFTSYMGFMVYQMDVKSAFLYGTIDEEVYVSQPPGFVDPKFPNKKSRYKRGAIDKTLFIKQDKKNIMLVQVYVDDIIFGSTKKSWCDEFEELMKNRIQMSSMGELTFFLRVQVKQKEDGIFISQDKYVAKILKKFDFLSVKTTSTPIKTQKPLAKDKKADDVDVHLYRSMISSLMYLTASRPDIMFAVYACSRFQVTPKTSHLYAVNRIFRYLKGQPKLGLWYPKVPSFDLEAYSNSDYTCANLNRKSTTGGCQFLGRRLIS
nr:copia protein [Tanacetum cinerariifolium]